MITRRLAYVSSCSFVLALVAVAVALSKVEFPAAKPRRPWYWPGMPEITVAHDWRHVHHETYDSAAGWWISNSLGLELYFDRGFEFVVGRYVRDGLESPYYDGTFRSRWTDRGDALWLDVTLETPWLDEHGEPVAGSSIITNLSSRRHPTMTPATQLAHMLWRTLDLAPTRVR